MYRPPKPAHHHQGSHRSGGALGWSTNRGRDVMLDARNPGPLYTRVITTGPPTGGRRFRYHLTVVRPPRAGL